MNTQSWKTVELSFLAHDPALYPPLSDQQHQEKSQTDRHPPPPVFDGSQEHKQLTLTLSGAALEALFNFVKVFDVWFIFLKGASRPTR